VASARCGPSLLDRAHAATIPSARRLLCLLRPCPSALCARELLAGFAFCRLAAVSRGQPRPASSSVSFTPHVVRFVLLCVSDAPVGCVFGHRGRHAGRLQSGAAAGKTLRHRAPSRGGRKELADG
jgi:hypothetical protein